jgi:hypothetical protein
VQCNLQLQAMPSGQASFSRGSGGVLTANLSLIGLTPGSSHFVELLAPQGSDLVTLFGSFTANATGAIDTKLQSSFTGMIPNGSRLVVLNGQPGTPVGNEPIAQTGPLNGASMLGQMNQLTAVEISKSGKSFGTPQGMATVVFDPVAMTLTVTVTASGLTPGAHAAHVHTGTCAAQGGVLFMLNDLVADSKGDINGETRVVTGVTTPPPASGWYLNLHQGNMNTILKNGKPTIAFRPLLCSNL